MVSFDGVAVDYDAARPSYPPGIYEALGDLRGLLVRDVGAGTGIATRQLLARGGYVIAVDRGPGVLARAAERTPGLCAILADGAVLPFRDGVVDLMCFAQSWHWIADSTRVIEANRVLADRGRWAAWWSHAWEDTEDWFDAYWSLIESFCRGTNRGQRETDWGTPVSVSGLFNVAERVVVPWERRVSVDDWMTDQATHSYVSALSRRDQERLLGDLRQVLDDRFADGMMTVHYETLLWMGTKA